MRMSLERLLEEGLIEKTSKNDMAAIASIQLAHRDLKSAADSLNATDYDWALAIAYNAMLQAATSLMYKKGFIPKGSYKHVAVARFLETQVELEEFYNVFDRYRKKRHKVIYDEPGIITKEEAEKAINWAEELVTEIENKIGWAQFKVKGDKK